MGERAPDPIYAQVVTLLLATDIASRIVSNPDADFIEVELFDGGKVLWSKEGELPWWTFTILDPDGAIHGGQTGLPIDAAPEEVAKLVATYDYPAPVQFPVGHEDEVAYGENPAEEA